MKYVELLSSYLKEFDLCYVAIPDLPSNVMQSSVGALVFRTATSTNQFEGHIRCTVGAVFFLLSLSVLESKMDLCLGAFFSSKRLIGPLCTSSNHHVLLMNFCLTESHILTRISECALHLPMLCCAYWNVCCATVVWFCFLLLLYQWCLFVNCYGWKFDSHLLLDEWVTKQHGCKYFV